MPWWGWLLLVVGVLIAAALAFNWWYLKESKGWHA